MKMKNRLKREISMLPVIKAGFSRKMASIWYKKTRRDKRQYKDIYGNSFIKEVHKQGFLCETLERYNWKTSDLDKHISNFDYIYLEPFNNSFSKWLQDIITTNRILREYEPHLRKVFYSIVQRNGKKLILNTENENREYSVNDIINTLMEERVLQLRPAFWLSNGARYKLEIKNSNLYIEEKKSTLMDLKTMITELEDINYIVSEYFDIKYEAEGAINGYDHYLKLWIANDSNNSPQILDAVMHILWNENNEIIRKKKESNVNLDSGVFKIDDSILEIENWGFIKEKILSISKTLNKLTYFTISVALKSNKDFKILSMSANPILPPNNIGDKLNNYLMDKAKEKKENRVYTFRDRINAIKKSRFYKYTKKNAKPGMRPYMYALWLKSVWDDLWNTKVSLRKKLWAWKRGFLSFRIEQYRLTEDNYSEFLSDYNYHWLNRINNAYQIWINDKTTFRYILEPFKEYIPQYYFSIFKRNGKTEIEKMQDCNEKYEADYNGIIDALKEKKKLALKPSAGTHGDGFYCLAFENGKLTVNGEYKSEEQFIELVEQFKSFYLITEYIDMNDELKKIYPKSVNSIRIMVINETGYEPKIMQSYMRIGSSRTGYTDNVGYGGICVMINTKTGEMYNPETIVDHKFYPCPKHPDTGTLIEGKIPYWDEICEKIKEICRYLSELEYLGFDIAVTNDGFQVIEINIHQDLHKVATLDGEVIDFYKRKMRNKLSIGAEE